jgi:hypothetical protein
MNSLAVLTFESPSSLEEVFTSLHHAILKDCLISVQTACHLHEAPTLQHQAKSRP